MSIDEEGRFVFTASKPQILIAAVILAILCALFFVVGLHARGDTKSAGARRAPAQPVASVSNPLPGQAFTLKIGQTAMLRCAEPGVMTVEPQAAVQPAPEPPVAKQEAPKQEPPKQAAARVELPKQAAAKVEPPKPSPAPVAEPGPEGVVEPGKGQIFLQVSAGTRPGVDHLMSRLNGHGFKAVLAAGPKPGILRVLVPVGGRDMIGQGQQELKKAGFDSILRIY